MVATVTVVAVFMAAVVSTAAVSIMVAFAARGLDSVWARDINRTLGLTVYCWRDRLDQFA